MHSRQPVCCESAVWTWDSTQLLCSIHHPFSGSATMEYHAHGTCESNPHLSRCGVELNVSLLKWAATQSYKVTGSNFEHDFLQGDLFTFWPPFATDLSVVNGGQKANESHRMTFTVKLQDLSRRIELADGKVAARLSRLEETSHGCQHIHGSRPPAVQLLFLWWIEVRRCGAPSATGSRRQSLSSLSLATDWKILAPRSTLWMDKSLLSEYFILHYLFRISLVAHNSKYNIGPYWYCILRFV